MDGYRTVFHRCLWPVLFAICLVPSFPAADEVWTDPYPGIQYLFETRDDPLEIHVVIADLSHPGISVQVTGEDQKDSVVSEFAKSYGLVVAVNGDYFEPWPHYNVLPTWPLGLSVSDGEPYSQTKDQLYGNLIAFSPDNRRVEIIDTPEIWGTDVPNWMDQVVSGGPVLVSGGDPKIIGDEERHPRTAVGIDATRTTLFLVTVDGRRQKSIGMTLDQLAEYMSDLDCDLALNLDGGGSTAMYIKASGGIVNYPSGSEGAGAILYPPGKERRVCNHLGLYFDESAEDGGVDSEVDSDTDSEVDTETEDGEHEDTVSDQESQTDAGENVPRGKNAASADCGCGTTEERNRSPFALLMKLF